MRKFLMSVPHQKGGVGGLFGIVSRIISLRKISNTNILDYMDLNIYYLKKSRVWGD